MFYKANNLNKSTVDFSKINVLLFLAIFGIFEIFEIFLWLLSQPIGEEIKVKTFLIKPR